MRASFMRRRDFIALVGATVALPRAGFGQQAQPTAIRDKGLRDIAGSNGLLYGAALNAVDRIWADGDLLAAYRRDCNIVVPENQLKWAMEQVRGDFDFRGADMLAAFAAGSQMKMRGHTLVWHQDLPAWVTTALVSEDAEQLVRDHIAQVVGRYKGRIHSWDVVNEGVDLGSGRSDGLRVTPFLTALGPRYMDIAFNAAREADPDALLTYNDYGIENGQAPQEKKRQAVLRMLEGLRARGVPVQALGIQSHLQSGPAIDQQRLAAFLGEVAQLGLQIMVTELDVDDNNFPTATGARDAACADLVRSFLDVVLARPETVAVLTWGLSDKYSWLNQPPALGEAANQSRQPRSDGTPHRPLPLDITLTPKPMWQAIASAIETAANR